MFSIRQKRKKDCDFKYFIYMYLRRIRGQLYSYKKVVVVLISVF